MQRNCVRLFTAVYKLHPHTFCCGFNRLSICQGLLSSSSKQTNEHPKGHLLHVLGNVNTLCSSSCQTMADFRCKQITQDNAQEFLDSFDTVLTDCDGVLWNDEYIIPGTPETLHKLKKMGKQVFYVTNNSSKSREEYANKCVRVGFPATEKDIICSAHVTAEYIKKILKFDGKVYLIGQRGLIQEFEKASIPFIGTGKLDIEDISVPSLSSQPLDPEVGCVVVGYDSHYNYFKCLNAVSYLHDPKCHFLTTNMDSGIPIGDGRVLPGTGSIVAGISVASQRTPIVMGKPNKPIFDVAVEMHSINPKRTIMIGDRLNTDIALGHVCGLYASILVLTGFAKLEDALTKMASNDIEHQKEVPHYYIPSLGDLGTFIDNLDKSS